VNFPVADNHPEKSSHGISNLLSRKPDNCTDEDWQTVTTDKINEPASATLGGYVPATGGSIDDFSKSSCPSAWQARSGHRVMLHPQGPAGVSGSYCVRNNKSTNRPVLIPKIHNKDRMGFQQNSYRNFSRPSSHTSGALRRLSQLMLRSAENPELGSTMHELKDMNHSYESLSSDGGDLEVSSAIDSKSDSGPRKRQFRWSRIRQNLNRDQPETTLTLFDQSLYRAKFDKSNHSRPDSYVPHDKFLKEIPQLPFPLISLQEAAMVQQFRRERGEEDHTEPSRSFSAKARSGTVSTTSSSQCPRTPISTYFDWSSSALQDSPTVPAPVHSNWQKDKLHGRESCESP
jgi:hypothetical protein